MKQNFARGEKCTTYLFDVEYSPGARVTVMEEETVELWHMLCVWAMNEPDLKRLMCVLGKLNAVLIKEEKAIKEEVKLSRPGVSPEKAGQSKPLRQKSA